jgi:hypothetical protein
MSLLRISSAKWFLILAPGVKNMCNLWIQKYLLLLQSKNIFHVVKNIRKNILKSGKVSHCKRHLMIDDKYIEWEHFKRVYLWDIASHPFPGI